MPRFKNIIFYLNSPKIKLFLQKNAKFSSAGRSPQTPVPLAAGGFQQLGASLPTPIGLRRLGYPPPTQNQPPHCEFLATRLNRFRENQTSRSSKVIYKNEIVFPLYFKSSEFLINSSTFWQQFKIAKINCKGYVF